MCTQVSLWVTIGHSLSQQDLKAFWIKGVKHVFSSVYHHQSKGQIEEFHLLFHNRVKIGVTEKRHYDMP